MRRIFIGYEKLARRKRLESMRSEREDTNAIGLLFTNLRGNVETCSIIEQRYKQKGLSNDYLPNGTSNAAPVYRGND